MMEEALPSISRRRQLLSGGLIICILVQVVAGLAAANNWKGLAFLPEVVASTSANGTVHNANTSSLQQQALSILQRMEERGAMNSAVSKRTSILHKSFSNVFPRQWKPCVLQRLFHQKDELTVTVVGGSTVARPGNRCIQNQTTDPYAGRYSNLLEKGIRQDSALPIQVINMGQGGEISTRGAFFLDRYIDPHQTDLLVWDYFLNDHPSQQVRMLDFWLTRVHAHYQQANRPPPPILLLYLWEFKAATKLKEGKIQTLDKNPMKTMGKLIDRYRALGWDIAAVNVGAAVNTTKVKRNTKLLIDDSLHPSCQGTHLIADLLEHALVSNLATKCPSLHATTNNSVRVPLLHKEKTPPSERPQLWKDLWNERTQIGSLSPWEPSLHHSTSNLRISNTTVFAQGIRNGSWPVIETGKSDPSRQDRKFGYRIPSCDDKHNPLELTLPDLQWIGLALDGTTVRIRVNRKPIVAKPLQLYAKPFLTHWIDLNAQPATLQLCTTMGDANLQYLVGVSVPQKESNGTADASNK